MWDWDGNMPFFQNGKWWMPVVKNNELVYEEVPPPVKPPFFKTLLKEVRVFFSFIDAVLLGH